MWHGKQQPAKLCPFSFGLALGITVALAAFIMASWTMSHPPSAEVIKRFPNMLPITWNEIGWLTLWMFIKGLIFGFVLALIYDLIICCCRRGRCGCGCTYCGGKEGGTCNCGCGCCDKSNRKMEARDLNGKL